MTVSDLLSYASIAVSIVFGLIVTHFCSVRDTRTRTCKDHYIEQLKAIKGRVATFFHRVAFGKSSSRKIISWYAHITMDIDGIDKGVRKSLDLQMDEFSDVLDKYYGEITSWDDYNNQFTGSRYMPSTECKQRLLEMKKEVDDFLNDYIEHVNQSNCYPIWQIQINRIKQNYSFYKRQNRKWPILRSLWERVEKHFWEMLLVLSMILSIVWLYLNIEKDTKPDLVTPLKAISSKQDSIHQAIKSFQDKYQPINVQTKTFNNSSFFNADKVDSVEIKLYNVE